jgi:hypothetical protein
VNVLERAFEECRSRSGVDSERARDRRTGKRRKAARCARAAEPKGKSFRVYQWENPTEMMVSVFRCERESYLPVFTPQSM